ncbi:hypothetical protein [Leptotrichia alba]|uniref:Uncharacterized protein n=1 Tax=Leptotrichia alba TaxID=3239304 RepID=A0AB39V1F3_9FUSO
MIEKKDIYKYEKKQISDKIIDQEKPNCGNYEDYIDRYYKIYNKMSENEKIRSRYILLISGAIITGVISLIKDDKFKFFIFLDIIFLVAILVGGLSILIFLLATYEYKEALIIEEDIYQKNLSNDIAQKKRENNKFTKKIECLDRIIEILLIILFVLLTISVLMYCKK